MDSETVKGKPLTKEESKFLLDLIEGSKIITSKTTNATNNKLKTEEWIRLAERFNATATNCPRTPQQLRLKWENLKKNSRKRSTKIRMNQIKTGGGPADYIPPDDILDRVTGLLGSTVSGFTVPFGGDKEVVEFLDCGGDGEGGSNGDGDVGDVRVSVVDDNTLNPMRLSIDKGIENVVTDYQVLDVVDQNVLTPNRTKRLTFCTPRAVRKKSRPDESRGARNIAVAEYYSTKKQCLNEKLNNIMLENENIKLRNLELKLNNEKLMLEAEKLKLELEKLRNQQLNRNQRDVMANQHYTPSELSSMEYSIRQRVHRFNEFVSRLNSVLTCEQSIELQLRMDKIEPLYAQYDEIASCIERPGRHTDRSSFEDTYFPSIAKAKALLTKKNKMCSQ